MKRNIFVILCVLLAASPIAVTTAFAAGDLFRPGEFFVGCNYWGSKAGVHMWRTQDWDSSAIEKDLAELARNGVEVLRVFPTWSEFQPLVRNFKFKRNLGEVLEEGSERPVYDPLWVEPNALARFRFFCDTAEKYNLKLMVSLVTGWMSGRLFAPRIVENLNLINDPEAIMWEGRFARGFVRKMKDHPAIVAWDLGNECNCMAKISSPAEAWNWLNTISSAVRMEDPSRPVVSGMHSQTSNGQSTAFDSPNSWNLQMQGELLDVLTPHPYPAVFRVDANRGPFNGFRNALHPVAQCLFYEGVSGKPAFPQELGSLGSCMFPADISAKGMRQQMWANWQHGMNGYLWWCAFDQMHLGYPPFCNNAMERQLGMLKADPDRKPTPMAKTMKEFSDLRKALPFKALPRRRVDAVCFLSERDEYFHQAFGAFMLAKQAGFDVVFVPAESVRDIPDAKLYILPSGKEWETYSQAAWERFVDLGRKGATLLVTRGSSTGYSSWQEVTGLEQMVYRESRKIDFEFDGKRLHAADDFTVIQRPVDCEVVARDTTGGTVVARRRLGDGQIIVVNLQLERRAVASEPNVFEGDFSNELWRLYAYAAREAGVERLVSREDSCLVLTEHPRADGTVLVVAVNTRAEDLEIPIAVRGKVGRTWNGSYDGGKLKIRGNDGCIFEVQPK